MPETTELTGYCGFAAADPFHGPYHDTEYGFPIDDDDALFGRLLLEINQAGLNWLTILKKKDTFRVAYDEFRIDKVAAYGDTDRSRLLDDPGIIRNRLKVEAAIHNAKQIQRLQSEHGSFPGLARRPSSHGKTRVGEALQGDVPLHGRRNHGRVPHQHWIPPGSPRPALPRLPSNRAAGPAVDGRDRMTYEVRSYRPPWWLPNPHAQTIGGKLLRSRRRPPLERHRLETPDGDFLDVDIGAEPVPGAPVAIVLHGLEGSMERSYARLMLSQLFARGIRPVGLNFRACSGEPNRRPRFYHSGDTGDLAFVVEYVTGRFPERRIGAVGFSLGGNVLLKFLGERGTESPLRAAAGHLGPVRPGGRCGSACPRGS